MAQDVTRGGTRWGRSLVFLAGPALVMLTMAALTLRGMIPLNLAITGQQFKMASRPGSEVVATGGVVAYPNVIEMKDNSHRAGLRTAIDRATLSDGVCISLVLTFPIVGTFTVALETTGKTEVTELGAYVDTVAAGETGINPETTDGKLAELDMSNVRRPIVANIDASEVALPGGHPGMFGLEVPGGVKAFDLRIGGLAATIAGTLLISGIKLPGISHGRGPGHGECF